jgi:hypothetical protein
MTAPPSEAKDARLERLRNALLDACNELSRAKAKALRMRGRFLAAQAADPKKRAKHDLEDALRELRVATLEFEAARNNFRREIGAASRMALDELIVRLERDQERYAEVNRLYGEATAAYEAAAARYQRNRSALGLKAKVRGKFDDLLGRVQDAAAARDKAFMESERAHRKSLETLERALAAGDEHHQKPTASNKLRRAEAWGDARAAFEAAERSTNEMARALHAWFEAENQFALSAAALEATKGAGPVLRLELRAQEMVREGMKLNWASLITDEALARMVQTIGELKSLA